MRAAVVLFIASAAVLPLEAQLSAPQAGNVRYANGSVHAVYGFDANFIIGPSWAKASAAAFSKQGGILASSSEIELLRSDGSIAGIYASSEPHPLLDVGENLKTAIAWLPASNTLLWWSGSGFQATQLAGTLPGTATSIESNGVTATLLVSGPTGTVLRVKLALATGDITSTGEIPGARGPAFAQNGYIVFRNNEGLAIEQANGDIRTLPFPAPDFAIERMSSDWLHIHSAGMHQDWALHLTRTICKLSRLPEPEAGQ